MRRNFLASMAITLFSACLMTALVSLPAAAQERYSASADNQEITDAKTGLIWRRCAEGMAWKVRTCAGTAAFFDQANAVALAKAAASSNGQGWRLPTMKELSGIVSIRDAEPGQAVINAVAFPATPTARFWTSTSVGPGYFMFVGFVEGSAGEGARNSPGAVRLVRNAK